MVKRLFWALGEFCASHPWEVIVATLTTTVCMLTVDKQSVTVAPGAGADMHCGWRKNCIGVEEYHATDVIIMTLVRCVSILYTYYQFCNLKKLGSNYILGIAGLFTVFSSFAFSSSVINFLGSDISDLKDALFFFLLLIDLSKATLLAQLALSASSQTEVRENIARGLALLGPTITLDTIVATLVIGVGTLSGIRRLEVLCCFACMSVIVNYVVFMTFYPACLSLILELSGRPGDGHPSWDMKRHLSREEDQKPNLVVQRVKVIMAAGLMLVHAHSRWMLREGDPSQVTPLVSEHVLNTNRTDDGAIQDYIMRWLTVSADQIVILILLLALAVKFMLFENQDDILRREKSNHPKMSATEGCTTVASSILHPGVTISSAMNRASSQDACVQKSEDKGVQTEKSERTGPVVTLTLGSDDESNGMDDYGLGTLTVEDASTRTFEDCVAIYKSTGDASSFTDEEVLQLVLCGHIREHVIEKAVMDTDRGVEIRRAWITLKAGLAETLDPLPYKNYDYCKVQGACCENVIGYMPVPVGVAGPLLLDDERLYIPLATTEGCLVASTHRGCRALLSCGVRSRVVADGMTRGPVVRFPSAIRASEAMAWFQKDTNLEKIKSVFNLTSRFARLRNIRVRIAGRLLFLRFVASTGDAMGMNMLSKGTEQALSVTQEEFPDMEVISLSGNYCTDKKPAAVNWIEGRGKSVVCEATVPAEVVTGLLKTSVRTLVDVNINKNLVGSSVAGSIGGFNAHAANIVTAIYIATGQDPAQNVGSSNCMTLMEPAGPNGEDLYITCTMPSIEVGTIGGGTILPAQASCLDMLGVKGPHETCPGENSSKLARIVCATVLAGELSLMSALAAGHLVRSHLKHNRSSTAVSGLTTLSDSSLRSSRSQLDVCSSVRSGL